MQHQDWQHISFNTPSTHKKNEEIKKQNSNKTTNPDNFRLEAPKELGKILSQARTTKNKTQKQLAAELGVSPQIYGKWELNKETPTNAQIALIEKNLGVKLPRCKKVKVQENEI